MLRLHGTPGAGEEGAAVNVNPIRVSVSLSRKINLGNYESADAFVSLSDVPLGASEADIEEALDLGRIIWDAMKPRLIEKTRELREAGRE